MNLLTRPTRVMGQIWLHYDFFYTDGFSIKLPISQVDMLLKKKPNQILSKYIHISTDYYAV